MPRSAPPLLWAIPLTTALSAPLYGLAAKADTVPVDTSFQNRLWAVSHANAGIVKRTLCVNSGAPNASDANPGTPAAPLKTIGCAVGQTQPGTRILVYPGVYREGIAFRRRNSGTVDSPVRIEALKPGTAVLDGGDIWTGWKPQGAGVFTHPWPYQWGLAIDHFASAGVPTKPLGRRSEMVFVDGRLYRQVIDRSQMSPGSYFVSENDGKIFVQPAAGVDLQRARVEVSVRSAALDMGSIWSDVNGPDGWPSYYVLRGLTIQHYTHQAFGEPALCAYGRHFLIEGCDIRWNNETGLTLRGEDIVLRNNQMHHNGSLGISVPPTIYPAVARALLEGNDTSDNNWRGAMGEFYGFAVAGMKIMTSRDIVLRRHTSSRNEAPGVWWDKDNRNITIEGCRFLKNRRGPGLWMEISPGPFSVRNTVSAFNETGVMISNSSHITLDHDVLYGNNTQIGEWSPAIDRDGYYDIGLTLRGCVIASEDNQQLLFQRPDYPNILATLRSNGNVWYRPDGAGWAIGAQGYGFDDWIAVTHQDQESQLAAPRLRDPQNLDFRPLPASPWGKRNTRHSAAIVTAYPRRSLARPNTRIYLDGPASGGTIRYTTNGTIPTAASAAYTGPIAAESPVTIKARLFGAVSLNNPVTTAQVIAIAPPPPDISLSDLTSAKDVVGFGGHSRINRSIQDKPLSIAGIAFGTGIGTHAASELVYAIPTDAKRFVAVAGIDDEVIGQSIRSSVEFEVYADSAQLFQTGVLHPGDLRTIDINLPPGARQLRLVVTDGGNGNDWDHADWADAGFRRDIRSNAAIAAATHSGVGGK